jgi:hypothetical protein
MYLKSFTLSAVALVSVLASANASAELVSADNGLAVYDTQTSTFWMNLRETAGLSTATLFEEMEVGGKYHGWRVAAPEEVFEMFSLNVEGYEENKTKTRYLISSEFKGEWISLFGSTTNNISTGFYLKEGVWSIAGVYRDNYPRDYENAFLTESWGGNYSTYAVPGYYEYGHYLIYDGVLSIDKSVANVPLPFLGVGLLGLLGVALGRKSKAA